MLDFTPKEPLSPWPAHLPGTSISIADSDDVERFVSTLFRYASEGRTVSLRAFHEGANNVFRIEPVPIGADLDRVASRARALIGAARLAGRVVFCPPIATFSPPDDQPNRAREQDLAEGLALSVECDSNPGAARARLAQLLGPPTVVVESGGVTDDGEAKLHLHWRLNEPTDCRDEHLKLKAARALATAIVGGDISNIPVVHPIRWPGSWHCKGEPRLARIVELNEDAEIDLSEALETLRAIPAPEPAQTAAAPAVVAPEGAPASATPQEEADLIAAIQSGSDLHGPLVSLSARLVGSGMLPGFAVKHIRAIMEAGTATRDDRWQARYEDIGRIVRSAEEKYGDDAAITPVDLWARYEPPVMPAGLLPPVIEQFARVRSEMMGADAGGIAMAALTVCAAAIPDAVKLKVKASDDKWRESARLWTGLIGLPSTKKSPIMAPAVAPLRRIDARLWKAYAQSLREYEMLSKADKAKVVKPKQVRVFIEDVTKEAAEDVIAGSPNGVLGSRDELAGWFGSMEKYSGAKGAAADRGFWLESFNGGEKVIDRVTRGHVHIPNLSVNILGGIQPEVVRKIVGESQEDGLIQRICPIVLRPGRLDSDETAEDVDTPYEELIDRLVTLKPPARVPGKAMDFSRRGLLQFEPVLEFDAPAQAIQRELAQRHHRLAGVELVNPKLAAHIGKYDGIFARLCVIWHCVENAWEDELPAVVTEETARRAARFLHEFLLPHAIAFYAGTLGLSDEHDRITAIAGYILAHGLEEITSRDVQRGDRAMRSLTHSEAYRLLEQLENFGWLLPKEAPGNSKARHWSVRPIVHKLYAERGRHEAERRKEARGIIADIVKIGG